MPRKTKVLEEHAPWQRPEVDPADAAALQSLQKGAASAEQQKRALQCIIHKLCATYDFAYRPGPDGERDTILALGRQFVGQQIIALLNAKISVLTEQQRILEQARRMKP